MAICASAARVTPASASGVPAAVPNRRPAAPARIGHAIRKLARTKSGTNRNGAAGPRSFPKSRASLELGMLPVAATMVNTTAVTAA